MHSTNYSNTFISVASDYSLSVAKTDPKEGTIGAHQLAAIIEKPYQMTSDDLLFMVYAQRNGISGDDQTAREAFFAKPQACLRASPLVKTLGFGVHHDESAKIAAFAIESERYSELLNDQTINKVAGMRSKKG